MTLVIEYWPPPSVMALLANVHASVGSVDDTVTKVMIIFFDAASTVMFGSSGKLGLTVALPPAAAAAAPAAPAAAALNDVTTTTRSVFY